MVSWPHQCSVGLSVILASALTSATPTHWHTHTHSHTATVHSRGVVSVAIESPGQQVNKGDAARGMSGEERRLGGRWWGWRVTAGEGCWEMQCSWGSCWPWPLHGGQMGCEGHWSWGRRTTSRGGIKALRPLALFKPGVINDKTHRHTERASWPLWARCWNSGPRSLVWSLSKHFWLMADSFPTTYYGNNTARDEEHNPAAALHGSLIPWREWILNARYSFKWKEKTAFLPLWPLHMAWLFALLAWRQNDHFLQSGKEGASPTEEFHACWQTERQNEVCGDPIRILVSLLCSHHIVRLLFPTKKAFSTLKHVLLHAGIIMSY